MFEKFLSSNLDSFRQRYEGTYGFYRDENRKRLLTRLDSIDNQRCVFVDAQGVEYRLNPDTQKEIGFEFLPPKSQWYNTERGAMYTQRIAQRQFSRGVTDKNLEIQLLKNGSLSTVRINFANLDAVYNSSISVADAIKNPEISVAVSPQFALSGGLVFLLREEIGEYKQEEKKFSFKLREPQLWRTELTDALAAVGYTAEIA